MPLQHSSSPQFPIEILKDLSHLKYSVVLISNILTTVAVELIDLLQQSFHRVLMSLHLFRKVSFGVKETGDIEMDELSIVDQLFSSSDLLGLSLFQDATKGSLEHGCNDVPILED